MDLRFGKRALRYTANHNNLFALWEPALVTRSDIRQHLLQRLARAERRCDQRPIPISCWHSLKVDNLTSKHLTATAESAKTLTGLVTVNNANKIATRLV
jgi:hypothetical protein